MGKKPPPAKCPGCDQNTRRIWVIEHGEKVGMRFRSHTAPCGLPCKTVHERKPGEVTHTITEECEACLRQHLVRQKDAAQNERYLLAMSKVYFNGQVYDKKDDPRKASPPPKEKKPPQPATPKVEWINMVIPPHVLKMIKIRAGFKSVVDAANFIERLYPLATYESSQKEAQGTSRTKRNMPGKAKRKSQRVDLYVVTDAGIKWTFYMKRNVLMTVHRNDDLDNIGPRSGQEILDESA